MHTHQVIKQTKKALAPGVSFSGFASDRQMLTHLLFEAGAVGAIHAHPHEQITLVLKGRIEFTLGEERMVLEAGVAVAVPGNVSHGVVALLESEVLDIFTPVRADLLAKLEG